MHTQQNSTNSTHSTHSTNSTLTTQQAEVISALTGGATVTWATKVAGVDRSTFYYWAKTDPDFVAELNRAKEGRDAALRAELDGLADAALDALKELLDPAAPPAVRLKVALQILAGSA